MSRDCGCKWANYDGQYGVCHSLMAKRKIINYFEAIMWSVRNSILYLISLQMLTTTNIIGNIFEINSNHCQQKKMPKWKRKMFSVKRKGNRKKQQQQNGDFDFNQCKCCSKYLKVTTVLPDTRNSNAIFLNLKTDTYRSFERCLFLSCDFFSVRFVCLLVSVATTRLTLRAMTTWKIFLARWYKPNWQITRAKLKTIGMKNRNKN